VDVFVPPWERDRVDVLDPGARTVDHDHPVCVFIGYAQDVLELGAVAARRGTRH
jgi:hypothetical protein